VGWLGRPDDCLERRQRAEIAFAPRKDVSGPFLHNSATVAGVVALPTGRAGAAEAVASAPSAPVRLAQAGTGTAAASSAVTTKSARLIGSSVNYA
jgi:hypothetical protein